MTDEKQSATLENSGVSEQMDTAEAIVLAQVPVTERTLIADFPLSEIAVTADFNIRQDYGEMDSLKESIAATGVAQPVILRRMPDGTAALVCGHRRVRACRDLGMTAIPALVLGGTTDEKTAVLMNFQENVVRQNLNPMEEADGVSRLRELKMTDEEICQQLGWSKTALTQRMNLLSYDGVVKHAVRAGKLTVRQASAISTLPMESQADFVARADTMTVPALQAAVRMELDRIASLHTPPPMAPAPAQSSAPREEEEDTGSAPKINMIDSVQRRLYDMCYYMFTDTDGAFENSGAANLLIGSLDLSPLSQPDLATLHDILHRMLSARGAVGCSAAEEGDDPKEEDVIVTEEVVTTARAEEVEDAEIRPDTPLLELDDPQDDDEDDDSDEDDDEDDEEDDEEDEDEEDDEPVKNGVDVFITRVPKQVSKLRLVQRYLAEDGVGSSEQTVAMTENVSNENPVCVAEGVTIAKAESLTARYRATGASVITQPTKLAD